MVFVTGGARGIGRAIVTSLAADGYDISFSYSASADQATQLRDELQAQYPEQAISSYQVDLGDRRQVDEFAAVIGDTDSLYGLAYNAGGSYDTLAALVDQDRAEEGGGNEHVEHGIPDLISHPVAFPAAAAVLLFFCSFTA